MNPDALAGMAFTLIFTVLIGGFIVLYPITRRLGDFLESKIRSEKGGLPNAAELRRLAESVQTLEAEVRTLRERQEFTDKLVGARAPDLLPRSATERGTSADDELRDRPQNR